MLKDAPFRFWMFAVAIAGLSMWVISCATAPVARYSDQAAAPQLVTVSYETRESGLRVGPLSEDGFMPASHFWPRQDQAPDLFREFATDTGEEGRMVRRSFEWHDDGSVTVRVEPVDAEGPAVLNNAKLDSNGAMVATMNDNGVIKSDFDPAALIMPYTIAAGQTIARPFDVTSTGKRIGTSSGSGNATVAGIGRQTIETPAGAFDAFVVDSSLVFKVGPAKVTLTQRAWVDAERGLVAEEGSEKVTVFGFGVHNRDRVSMLTDESPSAE